MFQQDNFERGLKRYVLIVTGLTAMIRTYPAQAQPNRSMGLPRRTFGEA